MRRLIFILLVAIPAFAGISQQGTVSSTGDIIVDQGAAGTTGWPVTFPSGSSVGIQTGQSSVLIYPGAGTTYPISSGASISTYPASNSTWPISSGASLSTFPASNSTWPISSGASISTFPASASTWPISGSVSIQAGGSAINMTQINGVIIPTGTGASGAGIQRVTVSNDSSLAANQSTNMSQVAGNTTLTGNGVTGTGSPRVTISSNNTAFPVTVSNTSGSLMEVQVGASTSTTNVMQGASVATSSTNATVIATYTVTAGKTFYLNYLEIEARSTAISASASVLGSCFLQLPFGSSVANFTFVNPTTSATDRTMLQFPEPLYATAGQQVAISCTPSSATSTTWFANFGGYQK